MYQLKKALYGLKQAPRAWYTKIDSHFKEQGYLRNEIEHTHYRKLYKNGDCILVSLFVDDIVYTSNSKALIEQFKVEMMKVFDMSNLGLMNFFLGLEVQQLIFVTQRKYVDDLMNQLNMKQYKYAESPMRVNEKS